MQVFMPSAPRKNWLLWTPQSLQAPTASPACVAGAGYAGWTAGQLEGEIRTGSWYVVEAEARDAFTDSPEDLWVRVLRRQRNELAFVSTYPADPTLN